RGRAATWAMLAHAGLLARPLALPAPSPRVRPQRWSGRRSESSHAGCYTPAVGLIHWPTTRVNAWVRDPPAWQRRAPLELGTLGPSGSGDGPASGRAHSPAHQFARTTSLSGLTEFGWPARCKNRAGATTRTGLSRMRRLAAAAGQHGVGRRSQTWLREQG